MNRDEFLRGLAEMAEKHNVGVVQELTPDMVCVCTPAKDWDPSHNDFWNLEDNKSEPRADVRCFGCAEPMVVSNWMYRHWLAMPAKPKVGCMDCVGKLNNKELKNGDDDDGAPAT